MQQRLAVSLITYISTRNNIITTLCAFNESITKSIVNHILHVYIDTFYQQQI